MAAKSSGRWESVVGISYVPDDATEEVYRKPGDRFDDLRKDAQWTVAEGLVIDHNVADSAGKER